MIKMKQNMGEMSQNWTHPGFQTFPELIKLLLEDIREIHAKMKGKHIN